MRTLLQMVQQAANEIGIPSPPSLFGSSEETARQLIALGNREAKEFASVANKNGGWQNLHKEYTFTTSFVSTSGTYTDGSAVVTVGSTVGIEANTWGMASSPFQAGTRVLSVDSPTQVTLSNPALSSGTGDLVFGKVAYDLPSDFEYFLDRTFWDNQFKWQLIGPITAQEKQILRYGVVATGPRNKFYVRQNKMWFDPVPASEFLVAYDYFSNAPIQTGMEQYSKTWVTDNDTYLLDEDVFIQGIKWRFLRAKGLDYAEEYENYMQDVMRTIARDGGRRDLPLNGNGFGHHFIDGSNVPDTGYGN